MKKRTQALTAIVAAAFLATTLLTAAGELTSEASSSIVINEFMADNQETTINTVGNYTDWIELYNCANYSVDISGMFLTDNLTNYRWQLPNGTVIEPYGYLLVWDHDITPGIVVP